MPDELLNLFAAPDPSEQPAGPTLQQRAFLSVFFSRAELSLLEWQVKQSLGAERARYFSTTPLLVNEETLMPTRESHFLLTYHPFITSLLEWVAFPYHKVAGYIGRPPPDQLGPDRQAYDIILEVLQRNDYTLLSPQRRFCDLVQQLPQKLIGA